MPPAGVYVRGDRSHYGKWVCSSPDRHRINPGERLCPLCRWKATRNIPVYYEEEKLRKQREEDALLEQYQQNKNQESNMMQQVIILLKKN